MTSPRGYTLSGCATDGVRVQLHGEAAGGYRRAFAPGDDWFIVYGLDGRAISWVDCEFAAVSCVLFHAGGFRLHPAPAWWPAPPRREPAPFGHTYLSDARAPRQCETPDVAPLAVGQFRPGWPYRDFAPRNSGVTPPRAATKPNVRQQLPATVAGP